MKDLRRFQGYSDVLHSAAVNDNSNDLQCFSIDQAATFLQVHRATIYRLIADGKIRYYRVLSNRVRFSRAHLEKFLEENERNGRGESRTLIGAHVDHGPWVLRPSKEDSCLGFVQRRQ